MALRADLSETDIVRQFRAWLREQNLNSSA
jgi:hypothetical protein